MTGWTLLFGVVEMSLADWGISDLNIRPKSFDMGTATFQVNGVKFDANELFGYGQTVKIKRDGVIQFVGRVEPVRRIMESGHEVMVDGLVDPWWYLDRLAFQRQWPDYSTEPPGVTYLSDVFLGQATNGGVLSCAEEMANVINFCIAQGGPMALDASQLPVTPIIIEKIDMQMCAEVLRHLRRYAPDAVSWWDHSTAPYPTIHIGRRGDLEAVTAKVDGTGPTKRIEIQARPDLQPPAVVISYKQVNEVDGASYLKVTKDAYPVEATGREFGAIAATVDLIGGRQTTMRATIETELIEHDDKEWWKRYVAWLARDEVQDAEEAPIVITPEDRPEDALPRALKSGQIAPWMGQQSAQETIQAKADFNLFIDGENPGVGLREKVAGEPLSVKLTTTDALSGTYSYNQIDQYAEPVPVGLAQKFYDSLSELQYQGTLTFKQTEVDGELGVGKVLNLTGGRAEWETMRALIQECSYNVDAGETTVTFGPAAHLSLDDLIEFFRAFRGRVLAFRGAAVDGRVSGGVQELGSQVASDNSTTGKGSRSRSRIGGVGSYVEMDGDAGKVHVQAPGAGAATASIEPSVMPNGKAANYRQITYDNGAGGKMKIWLNAAEPEADGVPGAGSGEIPAPPEDPWDYLDVDVTGIPEGSPIRMVEFILCDGSDEVSVWVPCYRPS
jgi:hypothetical protein